MTRLTGKVLKGWGYELIWASTEQYCGKLLVFDRAGSRCSMHFHKDKDETWLVTAGSFKVTWCDTDTAQYYDKILQQGDTWHNAPLVPHRLESLEDGSTVVEVSTPDSVEDNYRIQSGDSQTSET